MLREGAADRLPPRARVQRTGDHMKKAVRIFCAVWALVMTFGAAACSEGSSSTQEQPEPEKKEYMLMMGDSLFDFWKNTCKEDLGTEDLLNVAIGGTTSEFWMQNSSIADRAIERLNKKLNIEVDRIAVSLGTNDVCIRKDGKSVAEGENGLQDLLEFLHGSYPDAYIYLLTINICGETTRWDLREEVRECNDIMREYCAQLDWAEMVETETAFYNDTNYEEKPAAEYFTSDYLHFSEQGYELLAEIMCEAIEL